MADLPPYQKNRESPHRPARVERERLRRETNYRGLDLL
jgi:hypothetical protein